MGYDRSGLSSMNEALHLRLCGYVIGCTLMGTFMKQLISSQQQANMRHGVHASTKVQCKIEASCGTGSMLPHGHLSSLLIRLTSTALLSDHFTSR